MQSLPYSVYRAKGTVAIKGLNRRVIFHRVGARNILDQGAPWDGEQRNCRAVLLGKNFDGDKLLTLLRDCAVPRGAGSRDEVSEIFDELMESSPLTIDCEFREAVEQ